MHDDRERNIGRALAGMVMALAFVAVSACAPRTDPQAGPVAMPDGSIDSAPVAGDTVTRGPIPPTGTTNPAPPQGGTTGPN